MNIVILPDPKLRFFYLLNVNLMLQMTQNEKSRVSYSLTRL